MAFLETPDTPQPRVTPELLVGAVSPLWSYFGAAAAGGVAFWWMTRWSRPSNLEALFAAAAPAEPSPVETVAAETAVAGEPAPEPVTEVLQTADAPAVEPTLEPEPVTAEAAPRAEPDALAKSKGRKAVTGSDAG